MEPLGLVFVGLALALALFVFFDGQWIHNNQRMQRTYQRFGRSRTRVAFWIVAALWALIGVAIVVGIVPK